MANNRSAALLSVWRAPAQMSGDQENWMEGCCARLAEQLRCSQAQGRELEDELSQLRQVVATTAAQVCTTTLTAVFAEALALPPIVTTCNDIHSTPVVQALCLCGPYICLASGSSPQPCSQESLFRTRICG